MFGSHVYISGRIVPADRAVVSVHDAALLHGKSAFTTLLARNGRAFRLDRHAARLFATAEMLGLATEPDLTGDALAAAVAQVLDANVLRDARVRITLTPGGSAAHPAPPRMIVTADPLGQYPAAWYDEGVAVVTSDIRQAPGHPEFGNKTGCYLARVLARDAAVARGAEEAIWLTPDGRLAEACYCSVFLVADGMAVTPPLDTPVLPGIVREAVLELCAELGIACDAESPIPGARIDEADEMFLTASCSGIRPATTIDGRAIGTGRPGPVTRRIMAAYADLLDRECPPDGDGKELTR